MDGWMQVDEARMYNCERVKKWMARIEQIDRS